MIELRPYQNEALEAIGGRQRNERKSDAAILTTDKLPKGLKKRALFHQREVRAKFAEGFLMAVRGASTPFAFRRAVSSFLR